MHVGGSKKSTVRTSFSFFSYGSLWGACYLSLVIIYKVVVLLLLRSSISKLDCSGLCFQADDVRGTSAVQRKNAQGALCLSAHTASAYDSSVESILTLWLYFCMCSISFWNVSFAICWTFSLSAFFAITESLVSVNSPLLHPYIYTPPKLMCSISFSSICFWNFCLLYHEPSPCLHFLLSLICW